MPLWGLPLHSTSPNEAFSRSKDAECDFFFLASLQESSHIGLQGQQQDEEKDGERLRSCASTWHKWYQKHNVNILFLFVYFFVCVIRITPVQRFLMVIRTHSSSVGSSLCLHSKSGWEIQQVRLLRYTSELPVLDELLGEM